MIQTTLFVLSLWIPGILFYLAVSTEKMKQLVYCQMEKTKYQNRIKNETGLPGLHNAALSPDFEPTYKTGVSTMTLTMIQLFNEK